MCLGLISMHQYKKASIYMWNSLKRISYQEKSKCVENLILACMAPGGLPQIDKLTTPKCWYKMDSLQDLQIIARSITKKRIYVVWCMVMIL